MNDIAECGGLDTNAPADVVEHGNECHEFDDLKSRILHHLVE